MIPDGDDSFISENAADHKFNEFVSLMQDIPANEEFPEESNTVQEEIPDTYMYAEEVASLIEEIEVEKVAFGVEETKDKSTEHELLYQDSRITVGESLALTMAFIMRHKLSMVASNDLISLLELHCPKENNAVKALSQFKEHFQYLKHPMKKHFCCPNPKCQVYISVGKPKDGGVCRICSGPLSDKSFFIELPVEDQLQTILSRPGQLEKLKYRFKRETTDGSSIKDVYDGNLYKMFSGPGGFLTSATNISLLGNTDGVALIRSSSYGVWPVFLVINELPPLQRFSRMNRIFAGLWFGKGKPHFPTFLQPFAISLRTLYNPGLQVSVGDGDVVNVRGILLDVTLDSPAKALWLQMKQFNGYSGCSKCKEKGCQHVIGIGRKGRNRQCHIYPYNASSSSGHGEVRRHNEVKEQAIQVLKRKKEGAKTNYDIEGVLGLYWAFGIPTFDIIRGTAIDYMHCVCEGVVEQLLNSWFSQDNKDKLYFIGNRIEELDKEFLSIQPVSEVTRTPRSIVDKKDWKASEKKNFLLYYAVPLLLKHLPDIYVLHLMLLVGGIYRLLKETISLQERESSASCLKLFCAQAATLYGPQFMTYNVHQLLHLRDCVEDLGPLWSHSCFFFEDLNGDFRDLFHGTQNIDGQILHGVSVLQKLPELASDISNLEAQNMYSQLTQKNHYKRSKTEEIEPGIFVIGALEKVSINAETLSESEWKALRREVPKWGKIWTFKRCQINGTVYHSERYKRVTARNNFTVSFSGKKQSEYGFVLNYVKVQEKCHQASCMNANCNCQLECSYFALLRILDKHLNQLPSLKGTVVVGNILKVEGTTKIVAIPLRCIERKCMLVSTSNGIFVCHLANRIERD